MTLSPKTGLEQDGDGALTITLYPQPTLPAELSAGLGETRLALWQGERDLWQPRVLVATDGEGVVTGAALTTGRPHCAYRKIVDIVALDNDSWQELLIAARDDVPLIDHSHLEPVVVHLEEHRHIAPFTTEQKTTLHQAGFGQADTPAPSIPSTRPDDPSHVMAWSWWQSGEAPRLAPYFGQTTDVTCGAVSSLMALEHLGHSVFSPDDVQVNRGHEIAFWRRANNLPACEPVGLAVELADSGVASGILGALPRVVLSTPHHVLLEEYESNEFEKTLRIDLQNESRRQAAQMGVDVDYRWMEVAEIIERIEHGSQVLLLIDLTPLIGDPTPHWILATDVVEGNIVVSDPWVNSVTGETWVDTFALPISQAGIDLITRWGNPPYRGVIVLPAIT